MFKPIQHSNGISQTNGNNLDDAAQKTPLIQVINRPILPLPKEKFGKAKGILLGGVLAGFLTVLGLISRRIFRELAV